MLPEKNVFSVLSTMQWYDLLMRGKLSVYVSIYPFVADFDDPVPRRIPAQLLDELFLGLLLGVYWKVDLTCRDSFCLQSLLQMRVLGLASVLRMQSWTRSLFVQWPGWQKNKVILLFLMVTIREPTQAGLGSHTSSACLSRRSRTF